MSPSSRFTSMIGAIALFATSLHAQSGAPIAAGVHRVGGSGAEFRSIAQAVEAVTSHGIAGPVTLQVEPGTYGDQIRIGAIRRLGSDSDRVTIEAPDGATLAISDRGRNPGMGLIRIGGAHHLTIRGFTMEEAEPRIDAIIDIANSSHLTIENCSFTGSRTDDYGRFTRAGINMEGPCVDVTISGNTFGSFWYGIDIGGQIDHGSGYRIDGNRMDDIAICGLRLSVTEECSIENNTIDVDASGSKGLGIRASGVAGKVRITGNRVTVRAPRVDGISMNETSMEKYAASLLVANNVVIARGGARGKGIALSGFHGKPADSIHILHNSILAIHEVITPVHVTSSGGERSDDSLIDPICALYLTAPSVVMNNVIVARGAASALKTVRPDTVDGKPVWDFAIDHNLLYSFNGKIVSFISQEEKEDGIGTFNDWLRTATWDEGSISIDPKFISDTDLHPRASPLRESGAPAPQVITDLDGQTRDPLHPTLGAYEMVR